MSDQAQRPSVRVDADSAPAVIELLALAFTEDPTWSWVFPEPATRVTNLRALWTLYVRSAVEHRSGWMTPDGGAAAVWVPPGQTELTPETEAELEPLLRRLTGERVEIVLEFFGRFEEHHPHAPEHWYLSLLGTHPAHRGRGLGMALVAEHLARLDADGVPAYLESSNPANDRRYERAGFARIGGFTGPDGEPSVACMWRGPAVR